MAHNIYEMQRLPLGLRNFNGLIRNLIFLIACVMAFFLFSAATGTSNPKKAVQWERWQLSLSSKPTADQKVSLDIVFTGPKGKTFGVPAFTDDGKTFHFRTAFPATGMWQWKTICSDQDNSDLHDKKGKVRVRQYQGDNPLYKHGYLKVSDDKRYLAHDDGTPFLWIGDTGWNATLKSTMKEWCEYVDKRASQGFTVIQISPRGWPLLATTSFKQDKTIDPLFWKDLEDKIGYSNDKGLIVLMVGLGNTLRDLFAENPKNQKFESYVTGRLSSFMVILSPSFDQSYIAELNDVAVEFKKSTLHLLTQHAGTNYVANLTYRNTPSVDFCGMQSGHHGGNLPRAYHAARTWTLDMWNESPVKPVINIEAMYDAHGNKDGDNWREKDARKLGWISWLSGSKGYTYGAGDIPPKVPQGAGAIWMFNKDSTTYDFWRNAMDWPSAGQMTVMKKFFKSIEWWRLVPSHELVVNQLDDETLKMVVSETTQKDLILAYLPDNPVVVLDLKGYSEKMTGKWLNPVNGAYSEIAQPVIPSAKVTFTRPDGWEDALLILAR